MSPDLEKRKAALSVEQRAQLEQRIQGNRSRESAGVQRVPHSSPLPLSYAQERIWLHEQLVPGSLVHNRPANIRLFGHLDVSALHQALQQVVQRHEALRTIVSVKNGQLLQRIDDEFTLKMPFIDVSGHSDTGKRISELVLDHSCQSFDLTTGPFVHSQLVRIADDDHLLLLTFHHFAFDGWSESVLIRELVAHYDAFAADQKMCLGELAVQYADYAAWERQPAQTTRLAQGRSFWKSELIQPPILQLPTDFTRPQHPDERAGHVNIHVRPQIASALRNLAGEEHATIFSTLLTAFSVLLHRYSGQDDIIVGCPVAQRTRVETEDLIGVFINLLPFRTKLQPDSSFRQLLRATRDSTIRALRHQDVPFQLIVQDNLVNRSVGIHRLFQAMFVYERFPLGQRTASGVVFRSESGAAAATLVDLSLELSESQHGVSGYLVYRRDLWEPASIERMAAHFSTLLEGIVVDPDRQIGTLPLLTDGEIDQLVVEWNDTDADFPREKCVHELVEIQVQRTPNAVAITSNDQQLTYFELNERANRIAHYLRSKGVGPEVCVGLCLKRSADLVVGILGIWKAGGAYVPLDADYPPQRLEFMFNDAAIRILITSHDLIAQLPSRLPELLCLDSDVDMLARQSSDNPARVARSDNLAYVIYTSGSTGKPKGVLVEHHSVVNVLTSMAERLDLRPGERVLGFASPTFDISVAEFFLPLVTGGAAVIVSQGVVYDASRIVDEIVIHRPRIIQATPATWEMLIDHDGWGSQGLTAISGGEALPKSLATRLRAKCGVLWDFYGPTETTIWSIAHRVKTPDNLIGRPLQNTLAFVLDGARLLVPIGVWGELYIGGNGLARGYLNRPELTAERFIANPFSTDANSRVYRTGDRVRWRADGTLEFHGRLDNQVKLRGFRIELGEIESALLEHEGVAQCVVLLREDFPNDKRLVAYWVTRSGNQDLDLRAFLLSRLPNYMVPSAFVRVESLPVTTSGKIDRKSLPAPERLRLDSDADYVAPRNTFEQSLAEIWSEALHIDRIGIHDNFFELGGHSILAVQVCAAIERRLSRRVPLALFFGAPNIRVLAESIADETAIEGAITIVPLQTSGSRAPLILMPSMSGLPLPQKNPLAGLDLDRPLFAVGLRDPTPPWSETATLPEIARYFVDALGNTKFVDPPHILGYSFGGMLAYEVARQLQKANIAVGLLLIIDTGPEQLRGGLQRISVRYLLRFFANVMPWAMNFAFNTTASQKVYELRRKLGSWRRRFSDTVARQPVARHLEDAMDTRHLPAQFRNCMETNYRAFKSYVPGPYAGRLVLFRAKMRPLFRAFTPDLNWGQIVSGGIEVIQIPGNHGNILQEPHVRVLAAQVQAVLDTN